MNEQRIDPSSNFTLEVKNFGPIAHASVGLRPLTVFVGPSNTGKSYLAILAYALHKCFGPTRYPSYGRLGTYAPRTSIPPSAAADESASEDLREWLLGTQDWLVSVPEGSDPPPIPQHVTERIRSALQDTADLDDSLESEIVRCFGVEDYRELIRRTASRDDAQITLKIPRYVGGAPIHHADMDKHAVRYQLDLARRREATASGTISMDSPFYVQTEYLDDLRESVMLPRWDLDRIPDGDRAINREMQFLASQTIETLLISLFHPLNSDAFYLPASRTGVMHSHQTVVSALIQSATAAGRRPTARVPVLSGVLADFLDELLTLPSDSRRERRAIAPRRRKPRRRHREHVKELARLVETNMLKGSIELERGETNYPIFSYRPTGWNNELPLMRTSSMVSELAPVVLYLRHVVQPGDLLIIEEPESHLHPAMQSMFARELARLVHAGVRVLVTTHSEWFLEQIGNLVRLSELPDNKRSGIPGADVALRPDQVSASLFTPKLRPRGSVVTEIAFEQETGLYSAGYDEVSEALYNDSAQIFNRLQEVNAG